MDITFQEQYVGDIGIDAHIEIKNKSNGYNLVALQIKSGQSYFSKQTDTHYLFYFDEKHYQYWTSYSIPVVLLLVNNKSREIFWEWINTDNIQKTKNGYLLKVPKTKLIIAQSVEELLKLSDKPQYIKNLDYLKMSIPLIQAASTNKVILESEEWVNKCSGRGHIKLKIYDDNDNLLKTLDWNYWFPFQLYQDVFRRLFPWAKFEIDDDFYYDDDLADYHENFCVYDSEDDCYYSGYKTFEKYRESLPEIRYILVAREVGMYKLLLTPNKLGEAFLEVNEYLEKGKPYNGIDIPV